MEIRRRKGHLGNDRLRKYFLRSFLPLVEALESRRAVDVANSTTIDSPFGVARTRLDADGDHRVACKYTKTTVDNATLNCN